MLTAVIHINRSAFTMHPLGAAYWQANGWLLVSDLHLGKAAHLRKAGLPLPEGHDGRTLERLDTVIAHFKPKRLVILGDLFHSALNNAWDSFHSWCSKEPLEIHLVTGNHDLIGERRYLEAGITVHERLVEGDFILQHEPPEQKMEGHVLCGHIHPGVVLNGRARQHLRLPCFWIGGQVTVLPAFGAGTGMHAITPKTGDRVLACARASVVDVSEALAKVQPQRG